MGETRETEASRFVCPTPLRDHQRVVLGHGGGGALTAELVEQVFLRAFSNPVLDVLGDSCVLDVAAELAGGGRIAFSTDSSVVRPLVFPGGSLGDLFSSNAQEIKGAIYGLVIILFLRFAPDGLVGALRRLSAAARRWPLAY